MSAEPPKKRRPAALTAPAAKAAAADAYEQGVIGVSTVDAVAEARVLSSLFALPRLLDDLDGKISPADFGVPAHSAIYQAILDVDAQGKPTDPVNVADQLTRNGILHKIGGPASIDLVVSSPAAVEEFDSYVELIADRAVRRRLVEAARTIANAALSGARDASDLVSEAEQAVFAATAHTDRDDIATMPQVVASVHELMASARHVRLLGHSTGFERLDDVTAGLQPGQLLVVAARPGAGKSVFALQLARTIAEETQAAVPFLSYEMTRSEIGFRLLAQASGVDISLLMRGIVPDGMDLAFAQEAEKLAELRLLVDDRPPHTIGGVRSAMRRLARRGPLGAVVVDYLQLLQGDVKRGENRAQEVSDISRELKLMAGELGVPVIACSQLNRASTTRVSRIPQLSDLRESGCLVGQTRLWRADTGGTVTLQELHDENLRNVPVWSLDEDGRLIQATLTHAFATGHQPVYEMVTRSGRRIVATANHKFRTVAGWARLDELAPGVRIASPHRQPEPTRAQPDETLRAALPALGALIGCGTLLAGQAIHCSSSSRGMLESAAASARATWDVRTRLVDDKSGAYRLYISGKGTDDLREQLSGMQLWDSRAAERVIPGVVYGLGRDDLVLFMEHLIPAFDRGQELRWTTPSETLAAQVQHLLTRLGVHARTSVTRSGSTTLKARGDDHQAWLSRHHGPAPRHDDVLPRDTWSSVRTELADRGISHRSYAEAMGIQFRGSGMWSYNPTRATIRRAAEVLESPGLSELADSDVSWDEIVSITPAGAQDVYDATVTGTHNFIANGLVAHNSIEQDANIVVFLHRESLFEPTAPADEAVLIVGKNRNGQSGLHIPLTWEGKTTRFKNATTDHTARPTLPPGSVRDRFEF